MQVDKMFSAEAAITIGQTKHKRREGYPYNERVIVHCLKMAQRQGLVTIFLKAAPKMDGQRETRKTEIADMQMEKGEKI